MEPMGVRVARRGVYLWGAGAIALVGLVLGGPLVTLHALWALHVGAIGLLVGRGLVSFRVGGMLSSAGGVVFLPLILDRAGANTAAVTSVLVSLPLIIAALVPDDRPSVLIFSTGAIGWLGLAAWRTPTAEHGLLVGIAVVCSGISLFATVHFDQVHAAERRAHAERLVALERLAATERLAIIGKLVAGVAHELNNPLAYIGASARFLREDGNEPGEREEAWRDISDGLERIQAIVDDLRLFARPQDDTPTCAPASALREAMKLTAPRRAGGVRVEGDLADAPPVAMGELRLVQVLVNLLSNAIDAAATSARQQVSVRAEATGDQVVLVVEDTGPGLSSEALAHLFEPWFTTKGRRGTGLGLALCKEYVELSGGKLAACNVEGGGARFSLSLPLARE